MNFDTVFFIGPQGSGKGTQARKLAERLSFFYWEMGGILREVSKQDSELGHKTKDMIDNGVLIPDDFLLEIVKDKFSSLDITQGLIFDGIPRRLGQAEFLLDLLRKFGHSNMVTLFIDLPREESISRLLSRAKIENRADDTREAVEFRLQQYEQDTLPVLDYLRQRTEFITIDGRPAIEEVTTNINHSLQLS